MPIDTKVFVAVTLVLSITTIVFLGLYISYATLPVMVTDVKLKAGQSTPVKAKSEGLLEFNFTCLPADANRS